MRSFVVYYANSTQMNDSTKEKELLGFIFSLDNFCSYVIGSLIVVFIDHMARKYLFLKRMLRAT